MPHFGPRSLLARVLSAGAAILGVGALAGCGTPAHLDSQEKVAFARECASLVERNVADASQPRRTQLGGETLTLDSSSFYSTLEKLRGASTYNLHDPKHDADTARQPLDDCNPKPPLLSSLLSPKSSTTTTTSPTTTTVPGS